ncbi:MAG TPA: adenylate/guanylate cyclase domain-containing protein [Myxococcales bacterium]|nr:adenylate/guanylate cyclase domain-containing protein [Myxococcales bacterium]
MPVTGRGLPLRPTLVTGVIGLILIAAGAVGLSAYLSSRRVVSHLWHEFADEIGAYTTQRALRYLEPAQPAVALEQRLAAEKKLDPNDRFALLQYFHAVLLANPTFTWVSYGSADGAYISSFRNGPGDIQETLREQTPKGTRWRDFALQHDGTWKTLRDEIQSYDPRTRPWYAAASASDHGVWVEPFLFTSHQQPGFIYSAKDLDGTALRGVWAIQFEVAALSEFLATLHIGDTGRAYIVTRSGLVVGHPAGQTTETINGVTGIAHADHHPDPMLSGAWQALQTHKPGTRGFSFGPYLAMVAEFPPESGIDWRVIGVVPKLEYFGEARQQAWYAVLIGALAALVAAFLGAILSSRVSEAMGEISDEMDRVGRFELSPHKLQAQTSVVREVKAMADSTERMKSSLRSFGRYVPRELVQDLLLSGREAVLGGEKRVITTLFQDIAGFTTLSETMEPDELVTTLGEYFKDMSELVRGNYGTVDKYIGDAIMAFWNAPRSNDAHALFACRAALAMRNHLREMQTQWAAQGKPLIAARIGINTGEAVVGNIGSPERMNYTAMGDAVNIASRLEGLNKQYGTDIVLGEMTAKMVEGRMILRPIDWVALKGKGRAVLVHELIGETGKVGADDLRTVALHREALDLYRNRDFTVAEARFMEVHAAFRDPASLKMASRCKEYVAEPPPADWNGSYTMTEK